VFLLIVPFLVKQRFVSASVRYGRRSFRLRVGVVPWDEDESAAAEGTSSQTTSDVRSLSPVALSSSSGVATWTCAVTEFSNENHSPRNIADQGGCYLWIIISPGVRNAMCLVGSLIAGNPVRTLSWVPERRAPSVGWWMLLLGTVAFEDSKDQPKA